MKHLIILFLNLLILGDLRAQNISFDQNAVIQPYQLEITLHKTSLLIFPAAIKNADRGDAYVLAERVNGVENVLKVKAGKRAFEPSNLQVITADGKVYTFDISYAEQPAVFTIDLRMQASAAPVYFEGVSLNDQQLQLNAHIVAALEPFLKKGRFSKFGAEFYLQGIYIKRDVIFLSYFFRNHTGIRLDEGSLRFYIRDKKKPKRTAVQDTEIKSLQVSRTGKPENPSGQTIVVALAKFAVAEDKYFVAELMEQGGDRNASSKLDQSVLLKAKVLK